MALNDTFHVTGNEIADTNSVTADGSSGETGAAEIVELGGTGDANVYRETDVNGDGTFEVSVKIDSFAGEWHSQLNQLVVSASNNHRLRIENTSGASQDYYMTGLEVDD
jgi:hypothetical protein